MASAGYPILPISEISTYQTRWTIRARMTAKSNLRTFSKGNGQGKVYSIDLLDATGGEIRASFFNDAADLFFEKTQVGKCYTLSRGSVKVANRQFNNCNHRYELTFDKGAQVEEVGDDAQIDTMKLTPTDLRSVSSRAVPCTVDIVGVIVSFGAAVSFTSREGKELVKREITVGDDTAISLSIALWGDRAKQDDKVFEGNPLAGFKGVVVKEWNGGRSGSLLEGGSLVFQPAGPEAQRVQQWWSQGGAGQSMTQLSQSGGGGGGRVFNEKPMSLTDMRRASEQVKEQPELYNVVCRLVLVQTTKQGEAQPLQYMACQERKEGSTFSCNRRVDESGFCAACGRAGKAAPRFNLRCRFADAHDSVWLTTFHEAAQRVLGMTAEEAQILERGDGENGAGGREALEAAIRSLYFRQPFQATVKAKLDSYNGELRSNVTCVDVRPVPRREHGRALLGEIREMLAMGSA